MFYEAIQVFRRLTEVWEALLSSNRAVLSKRWDWSPRELKPEATLCPKLHLLSYLQHTLHHAGFSFFEGPASPGPVSFHRKNDHLSMTHTWTSVSITGPWFSQLQESFSTLGTALAACCSGSEWRGSVFILSYPGPRILPIHRQITQLWEHLQVLLFPCFFCPLHCFPESMHMQEKQWKVNYK